METTDAAAPARGRDCRTKPAPEERLPVRRPTSAHRATFVAQIPSPRGCRRSMAISVPVRTAEPIARNVGVDLFVAAVFRGFQICRSRAGGACPVSSRVAVHKKRVLRYNFAKLSNGDVMHSRKPFP